MHLWRLRVEITDDPASAEYIVLVVATDGAEARPLAREAAIATYRDNAGGWSHSPKAQVMHAETILIPEEPAVLAVSGGLTR